MLQNCAPHFIHERGGSNNEVWLTVWGANGVTRFSGGGVASLTDPGSAIRSCYISDLSLSFRNALENVTLAFVDATALLDQK